MGTLKESQEKLSEQLKKAVRVRDSSEAGLKNAEQQAEEQRKQLHYSQINLATERQLVKELQKAKEAAQLAKEAGEAKKQASNTLGVEELKPDLQRNSLQYVGSTMIYLGAKPLMLLGSLWTLT